MQETKKHNAPKVNGNELDKMITQIGIKKANTGIWQLVVLGMLAGLYISIGGQLFLVALSEGMGKVVGGAVFSVGLVLVILAGAELFTGNVLMVVGALAGKYSIGRIIRNWIPVYFGNFVGAFVFAILIWKSGLMGNTENLNALGELAAKVAEKKLALSFSECFIRGIFCNMLVILAIIMATMSKDIISKIICCVLPIMTFVACGFEHCVANMYLIPIGLFAGGESVVDQYVMINNILPVTLGNILGGMVILLIHPKRISRFGHLLEPQIKRKSGQLLQAVRFGIFR